MSLGPFHSLCHFCLMSDFTASLISEKQTGEFKVLHAYVAALLAASLPFMPTCGGTQQNKMWNPLL